MPVPNDQLVAELRALATELGRAPMPADLDAHGDFAYTEYQQAFDSWYNALTTADLEPPPGRPIPDEELLAELRRVADALGTTPTEQQMNDRGGYSAEPYKDRFGSWNAAVETVGLDPNTHHETYTREELLAELRRMAEQLDQAPTERKMNDQGAYRSGTYRYRFGSWNAALEAAGLAVRTQHERIPTSELLTELQRLAETCDGSPTTTAMNERGAYSTGVYFRRFDSWNEALAAAGLAPVDSRLTREELLAALRQLADELGDTPRAADMNDRGPYTASTYRRAFGSWTAAIDAAGLPPRDATHNIPTADLLAALRSLADDLDRPPRTTEMQDQGPFSPGTYINRFGSWADALEAAGLSNAD